MTYSGMVFKWMSYLETHSRIHTGNRPFIRNSSIEGSLPSNTAHKFPSDFIKSRVGMRNMRERFQVIVTSTDTHTYTHTYIYKC